MTMNHGEHRPLTVRQLQTLHSDLHPSRVANRQQGGRRLAYVEAWDIKAMLIRVFGYGGFSSDVTEARIVHEETYPSPQDPNKTLWRIGAMCTLRLSIHQTGATYTETAVSSQSGPDWGEVADFAIKTAESDALKRAAINLGSQFGLSLYNDGATRDVVRRVFAPDQDEIVEDLVAALQQGPEAAAARERLQARFKVHAPADDEPEDGDGDEPAPEPARRPRGTRRDTPTPDELPKSQMKRTRKAPSEAHAQARQALADAEKAAGVTRDEEEATA